MTSPEANPKATALPQLGLSAIYRLPNVSQNVQYDSLEGAYRQAAARAASPPPRPHAPPGSPVLSAESGNDPQNVDDPGFPFGLLSTFPFDGLRMPPDGQFGPEDDHGMSNPSDSLRIGPKGESSFPCLSDFSRSATPMAGSSPLRLHSYSEGEYPVSGDFRNSIPEIPPPPQGSPLQTLTLEGITRDEDEFKMVDEMYVYFPNLEEYVLIFSFLVGIRVPTSTTSWSLLGVRIHLSSADDLVCNLSCA
jgi:hypothetical protein